MPKSSRLFLLGFLTTALTFTSNNVYGQLNIEYLQQNSKEQQCKRDWWPNAQYEYNSISPERSSRILVTGKDVFLISYKVKCSSEFIGYIDSDYAYSQSIIRHFSIEPEKLIEYYKYPNQVGVKTKAHMSLNHMKSNKKRNRLRREW